MRRMRRRSWMCWCGLPTRWRIDTPPKGKLSCKSAEIYVTRNTSSQDAYDAWFRAQVIEGMEDHRPAFSHRQVMDEAQALLERKQLVRIYGKPT
ncbi:hypothetical protein [Dyella sp. SG562]|uniref:antitoxin PaaA2 family protein n=1 Tax=Dyella sp. SG562 TaxID=2587017 RepID=UPI0031B8ADDD